MRKFKKFAYILIALLLISIMLVSSILFLKDKKQDKEEQQVFDDLIDIVEQDNTDNLDENNNIDYSTLFDMNSDMVAWIKIDGTSINYPVMQTRDRPNYYLRKNFYKQYSYYGTPYIQENCDIKGSDNLIIYGHHINNSKMFGVLEKYKSKTFFDEHKIIDFITKENIYKYKVIYAFKTSAKNGFKYYEYFNFEDKSKFETFKNKCEGLTFYNTEEEVNYGDKFITLSTCDYSQENGRMVVIAKKI